MSFHLCTIRTAYLNPCTALDECDFNMHLSNSSYAKVSERKRPDVHADVDRFLTAGPRSRSFRGCRSVVPSFSEDGWLDTAGW